MRKHLTRIAILAALTTGFISIIGASASPASAAANCTSDIGGIYFPGGDYAFPHTLYCSGVNGVEFKNVSGYTGFTNLSEGVFYNAPIPPNPLVYGLYYVASSYSFIWYRHRICNNSNVVKVAYGSDQFRIRNANGSTWGSWRYAYGNNQDIWCYA